MDSHTFDNLVGSLKKNNFTYTWLETIPVTIGAAGRISTSQVVHLLKFLPSDDAKLQLAKMAYGYVINETSYGDIVGDAFSSNDTKAALNGYIDRRWR